MVTSGLAGEVLQVRDRSGRDWCGRRGWARHGIGKAVCGKVLLGTAGKVACVGSGTGDVW